MWPIVVIIFIMLGGIYLGIMMPAEAAVFAASVALVFAFMYQKMTWRILRHCLLSTVVTSASVRSYGYLGYFVGRTTFSHPRCYLPDISFLRFQGCFFDGISMMVLTLAIVYPIIISLGFGPVWFGIALVSLLNWPHCEVFTGVTPFVIVMISALAIITFPEIAVWLPFSMRG